MGLEAMGVQTKITLKSSPRSLLLMIQNSFIGVTGTT